VICWRKGGGFDTFVRARALKGELSAVHGEGWGNFWLPCTFSYQVTPRAFHSAVSKMRKQTPPEFELGVISTTSLHYPELGRAVPCPPRWSRACAEYPSSLIPNTFPDSGTACQLREITRPRPPFFCAGRHQHDEITLPRACQSASPPSSVRTLRSHSSVRVAHY